MANSAVGQRLRDTGKGRATSEPVQSLPGPAPPPDPQLYQVATDVLQPPPPPAVLTHAALPVLFCITGLLSWQLPAHCVPHM